MFRSQQSHHHQDHDHPLNLSRDNTLSTYENDATDEDDNDLPLDLSVKRFNTLQELNTIRSSIFHLPPHPYFGRSFLFLNASSQHQHHHHPFLLSSPSPTYVPNGHRGESNNFLFHPPSFIPPQFPTLNKNGSHDSREDIEDEDLDVAESDNDDDDDDDHGGDGQRATDTICQTTLLTSDRKRITRPLTGRYVRNGTGASPSTLVKLRQVIMEKMVSPSQPKVVRRSRTNKKKPVQSKRVQLFNK